MEFRYDTVIIGAGPAGAACGITLQKRGVNHCIIDKAVFPRSKTCAGLVTGKALRNIKELYGEDGIDELFCAVSSKVKIYNRKELLTEAPISHPVHLVNRRDFDNALVEKYRSLGGELREGECDIAIDFVDDCVVLENGDKLFYKTIVFADGALSLAHKLLYVPREKLAFGVEVYLPAEKLPTDSVDLYFGYLDSGYVWVFPHGDTVCVGVANIYHKKEDYQKILAKVLSDLGVETSEEKFIGAFLPYGFVVPQKKLPDNVLLAGDAGGFTDPISGEGLYMAIKTGIYAAESVLTPMPQTEYLKRVKPFEKVVKDGKKLQKMFYKPSIQSKFIKKVKGNSRVVSFFFDNQVDEYKYTYHHMPALFRDYKRLKK